MYNESPDSGDWLRQPFGSSDKAPKDRVRRLKSLQRAKPLEISTGERRFHAPTSADELAALLHENPNAVILAGGTDVGLWVTKQHRELDTVLYTGNVREMRELKVTKKAIQIGAAVSLSDAAAVIVEHFPFLDEVFLRFASPPIRNAGTLGGNVANGSPIGDTMPALMVAGTSLVLRSDKGTREVALEDFYHDYMVNELKPGEFLESLALPLPEPGVELRSYKISKRFDQDISAACAAFMLKLDRDRVASVRIAFGGLAATIQRARRCEEALLGQPWNEDSIARAMEALASDFAPISDMRASAEYRMRVAQNFLRRLYLETQGELTDSVYCYGRTG
jgi:xanthine dehydrogenase small subunit